MIPMKTIVTATLLLLSVSISSAQTGVISTKSHGGSDMDIADAKDHFGGPPIKFEKPLEKFSINPEHIDVDTITKINEHCVEIIGTFNGAYYSDSYCNYWYYEENGYNPRSLREYHGSNIVLIGFEESKPTVNGVDAPFSRMGRFGFPKFLLILVILAGFGSFVFAPEISRKK